VDQIDALQKITPLQRIKPGGDFYKSDYPTLGGQQRTRIASDLQAMERRTAWCNAAGKKRNSNGIDTASPCWVTEIASDKKTKDISGRGAEKFQSTKKWENPNEG